MNTAAIRVGRLLEIRLLSYQRVADVAAVFDAIGAELARVPSSTQIVTATDFRHCPVMSSDAAEFARRGRADALARRGVDRRREAAPG